MSILCASDSLLMNSFLLKLVELLVCHVHRGLLPREVYRLEGETQYPENTEIPSAEQNSAPELGQARGQ